MAALSKCLLTHFIKETDVILSY